MRFFFFKPVVGFCVAAMLMLLTGPDVEHLCPFKNLLSSFAPAWLLNITIIHLFRIEGSSFIQESTEVILIPLPPTFWKKKTQVIFRHIVILHIHIYKVENKTEVNLCVQS